MQCVGCGCKYTWNGKAGQYCCHTCKSGTPCQQKEDGSYPHDPRPGETFVYQHKNGDWTCEGVRCNEMRGGSAMGFNGAGISILRCSHANCYFCKKAI